MRIALALTVALAAAVVHAAKLPPPMKLTLVQASCNALPPAVPGPCSPSFRFASGLVIMKALRQPQPTCPKTGQPPEAPGGTIQMRGVTKGGAAFTGSLQAQVNFKTTFGADPNGNCELAGLQVPNLTSLLGTLTCKNGTCKGTVYPIQCLPKQCADTAVISELGSVQVGTQSFGPVVVLDDAGNAFATPGTSLAPGREP
jgi:hypothetical protein